MGLNIKNERVCALAKQAADEFDMTQTSVIERALEEYLAAHAAEQRRATRRARMESTLTQMRALLTEQDLAEMQAFHEGLYDEAGLPR